MTTDEIRQRLGFLPFDAFRAKVLSSPETARRRQEVGKEVGKFWWTRVDLERGTGRTARMLCEVLAELSEGRGAILAGAPARQLTMLKESLSRFARTLGVPLENLTLFHGYPDDPARGLRGTFFWDHPQELCPPFSAERVPTSADTLREAFARRAGAELAAPAGLDALGKWMSEMEKRGIQELCAGDVLPLDGTSEEPQHHLLKDFGVRLGRPTDCKTWRAVRLPEGWELRPHQHLWALLWDASGQVRGRVFFKASPLGHVARFSLLDVS